jgi:RNA polymerase sigma-70 factor (ECF subfamily)
MERPQHNRHISVLESMFTAFYPVLAAYCAKYVKDQDAARDIIQDIFLTVWEQRAHIDFSIPLHAYFLRMAHNATSIICNASGRKGSTWKMSLI